MNKFTFQIAAGGERRLRQAVEAQVRRAHQDELSRATDDSQRAVVEATILRKMRDEMRRVSSPYSLWAS
jgi:hypothetical protein